MYAKLPQVTLLSGDLVNGVTIRVPNPPKTAILGLPSNEQLGERMDSQKSIRRSLGRRKSQTDYVPNTKGDLTLFDKIRLDKEGPEFDEFEASSAISRLLYVDVVSCDRVGDTYEVTLKTPFGEVKHTLSIPLQRDIQRYRRNVVTSVDLPHGQEELKSRSGPSCDLYAAVIVSIDGYTDDFTPASVPPHHKSAAVVELVQAVDDLDPVLDPNL